MDELDPQGVVSYIRLIVMNRFAGSIPVRTILSSTLIVGIMLSVIGPVESRTDRDDPSLGSMLSSESTGEAEVALRAEGPIASLAALAGRDPLPVPCATTILEAMDRVEHPVAGGIRTAAAAPPALDNARLSVTPDGRFAIRYPGIPVALGSLSVDRDRNGHPDLVDRISESLQAARSFLVTRHGYPPVSPNSGALEVFIMRIGHGLEGYTISARDGAGRPVPRFIVLDSDLADDRVMAAVLHQLAHASLMHLSAHRVPWWAEATASYLSVSSTGDYASASRALTARLVASDRSLTNDGLLLMRGSLLWPQFLADRTGDPFLVRRVWQEIDADGGGVVTALERTLVHTASWSLRDGFREYVAWNLFTGTLDEGRHYSIGGRLPDALIETLESGLPFQIDPIESIQPLGSLAFSLRGDGRKGDLNLEILAEDGEPAADLFASYRSYGPDRVLLPVSMDASGTGRIALPWSDLNELWIVLRNESTTPGNASRFRVRGTHDPYGPFDLASFTARSLGPALQLEWTTASEKGLLGWNVRRGDNPEGPFVRINSVAVPAFGDSSSEIGYVFVDESLRPGRRYYYLLEGLTSLGLVERTHVISGRALPRP
jgi:hypothetical protein